jgi:hypothetical protein
MTIPDFDSKLAKLIVKPCGAHEFIMDNHLPTGEPTKLGHVFKFLPSGILHKEETGIGATTLELQSNRNSIIVEPLRSTAWTKSQLSPDYFFVGTKPDGNLVLEDEIKGFITKQEGSGQFVKIICVADSLRRVIDAIGKEKIEADQYHLLIDESDSFQTASSYRKSMENVLDYYKNFFRAEHRSMVTATPLVFTDPRLKDEQVTRFSYFSPIVRPLALILTDKVVGLIYSQIKEHFNNHPEEKLVVALNNVGEIRKLADKLVSEKVFEAKDIKVLCSRRSEKKVKRYFHELMDSNLPAKLVFKTSAYFVGYDLEEKYHLIIGVRHNNNNVQLSEQTIKQIVGRARSGLHSIKVICSQNLRPVIYRLDFEQLLDIAINQLEGYKCLLRNFENSKHLLEEMQGLRQRIEMAMKVGGYTFIREDINDVPGISYLNIDGYIEESRIRKDIYAIKDGLKNALQEIYFDVTCSFQKAVEKVNTSADQLEELKTIKEILERDLPGASGKLNTTILDKPDLLDSEKRAYEIYYDYQGYIDADFLKDQIMIRLSDKSEGGTKKALNSFEDLLYHHLLNPTEPFKKHILAKVEVRKRYSENYLISVVNDASAIAGLHTSCKNFKEANSILNKFFKIKTDNRQPLKPVSEIKNKRILYHQKAFDKNGTKIDFHPILKYVSFDVDKFRSSRNPRRKK